MAQINLNAHLNFNQNQALGFVLENLATAPLSPFSGQMYFNTTESKAYEYNGTSWAILGNLTDNQIKALFSGVDGITYNSATGEFSLDVDNSTLQVGASGAEIKDGGVTINKIADSAVGATKLNTDVAGTGLALNGTTNALEVDLDVVGAQLAGSGMVYDSVGNVINLLPTKYSEDIGDGALKTFTITHNLNSQLVKVYVFDKLDNYKEVLVESSNTDANTSVVNVNDAPANLQYAVVCKAL